MTHRLFSRNAASSRAIPISRVIENIQADTAKPLHWGKNKRGMLADEEVNNCVWILGKLYKRETAWNMSRDHAIHHAKMFSDAGYHKQIVNRLLEPYQMIKVICSATEYDNFFHLRNHKDAQPEIHTLAKMMSEAYTMNKPVKLDMFEWHLPYIDQETRDQCVEYALENGEDLNTVMLKVSASCCAQVSYRKLNPSIDKALKIYDKLVSCTPVHASPFEHQASPMSDQPSLNDAGVTHLSRNPIKSFWSGNFRGWVQYRQLINAHTCWYY